MEHPNKSRRFEQIAQAACARLLSSAVVRTLPHEQALALVTLAFAYGAAWALDEPRLIEIADHNITLMGVDDDTH